MSFTLSPIAPFAEMTVPFAAAHATAEAVAVNELACAADVLPIWPDITIHPFYVCTCFLVSCRLRNEIIVNARIDGALAVPNEALAHEETLRVLEFRVKV